ncbi:MAG TPA: CBS domain-containing protein [Desulfuromonadaceae bacterium]|jgi:CBS domain-containing protein
MTNNNIISEIFLSDIIGKTVIDARGDIIGVLRDLVMVPGEVFPEVSHILIKSGKKTSSVPWSGIALFNRAVISVAGLGTDLLPSVPQEGDILVKRDILDKQIVDVDGAKVVRVNDVKLGNFYNDRLCIFSVDIGLRGLLRRLGYEAIGENISRTLKKPIPNSEISWEYVQPLEPHTSRLALTMARDQMNEMHPADIADIIENIPIKHIRTVLDSIDTETTADTLYELESELRSEVIEQLGNEQASDVLEEMEHDEAADVLAGLSEEKAQELLEMMDQEDAEDIQELLEHEEDSAGGLMNPDYFRLTADITAGRALELLKESVEDVETFYYGYVVDEADHLEGIVSLKSLIINRPDTLISDIMNDNIKNVKTDTDPEDVVEVLTKYNLLAVPVLEHEKMAGIVTVDDILAFCLPYVKKRQKK